MLQFLLMNCSSLLKKFSSLLKKKSSLLTVEWKICSKVGMKVEFQSTLEKRPLQKVDRVKQSRRTLINSSMNLWKGTL